MDRPGFAIVPVEIRRGVTVQIGWLPWDLTREEADKIARVVLSYAAPATIEAEKEG